MTKFLNNADVTGYISQTSVTSSLLKTDSSGKLVAAVAGTDYNAPDVSAVAGTLIREIRNATGATLTKGTVVYISGATGNKATVSKALATGDSTSAQTFGLCQTDIANNSNGYLVCVGDITGLDTSAFTEGVQLYLSSTTAGAYTSTKQYAPAHLVYIGVVTRSHPTLGQIEVKIQNGYEMDELHNVAAQTPSNNEGLFYETATSLWKNKSIATVLGYTPVDASLTANYVPKATGATTLANSNIQDSGSLITLGSNSYVNGALGIGTASLTGYNLRVSKNITGATTSIGIHSDGTIQSDVTGAAYLMSTNAATQAASFTLNSISHYRAFQTTFGAGSTVTNQYGFLVDASLTGATNNYGFYGNIASGTNRWNIYMSGTASNYMAGALGIGRTSLSNMSLGIDRNMSGATSVYGVYNSGTIQSDVTSTGVYYTTAASTAAASFTLTNLLHYAASQSTFGAGSIVTAQTGYNVSANLIGATSNFGFRGQIPAGTGRWNLFMDGTADNYIAGNVGIGVASVLVSSGPILTTTLTNGGSGYVDGTYTDVASSQLSSSGVYSLFTIVVSGGIVTTATLTWGGTTYRAGDTLTVSNTLLGGTGSGLVITVDTVDSSQLTVASANGGDVTLYRNDTSSAAGENIGTIKWESRDSSIKASGIWAEIGAYSAGSLGGAYLSFFTRSVSAGTSLVEAMRIDSRGGVGIGATVLTQYGLKVARNITGAVTSYGISNEGIIQSDATSNGFYYNTIASTAAASFTTGNIVHYFAQQGTFGAGSTVTRQYGFFVAATLIGGTNNYGFYGDIASGTNRWNLYMNGTAANYMAGSLGIGSTVINSNLYVVKNISGGWVGSSTYGANIFSSGAIQSDVTSYAYYFVTRPSTAAAAFTLTGLVSYNASNVTIGSGSAVTSVIGYLVENTHIGGTNNYGFRGDLAAATNTYNLFMNGTATNYLAGQLGVGVTSPNASAKVQIDSTTQGFLPPRMTSAQRTAISSAATGLIVYQTDGVEGLWINTSTGWRELTVV